MTGQPNDGVPEITQLIRRAQQVQTRVWAAEISGEEEVTPPQGAVLRAVGAWPDLDQTLLAKTAFLDRSTVTEVVHRLTRRGYLRRRRDRHDQRRKLLRLTPRGQELCSKVGAQARSLNQWLFELLEPEDRSQFVTLLTAFVERAEAASDHELALMTRGE